MGKFQRGKYTPENPEKYAGKGLPEFRSSWERDMMTMCDNNPAILSWASEPIKIPYVHPYTGRVTNYVPDFLIHYVDSNNSQHVELIEIKPSGQTTLESAKSKVEQEAAIINGAKWEAALEWCAQQGIRFRIMTENDIYHTKPRRVSAPRVRRPRTKRR